MTRIYIINELYSTLLEMWNNEYKYNLSVVFSFIVIVMISAIMAGPGVQGQFSTVTGRQHRTNAATLGSKEIWCYHCNSMDGGDRCVDLKDNRSEHHMKCPEKTCMVKRISLTTSTGNSTGSPRLWLLERNCSKACEPGCIMIGERTKLHACTTCCEGDFCNDGNGSKSSLYTQISAQCYFTLFVISLKKMFFC